MCMIQDSRICKLFSLIALEVNILNVTALFYVVSQYNNKKSKNKPALSCHHLRVWLLHYCVTNDIKIICYGYVYINKEYIQINNLINSLLYTCYSKEISIN